MGSLLATASPAFAQADAHADTSRSSQSPAPPTTREEAAQLPPFIPPVTDEDRKAAFPDVEGHAVHDHSVNYFVLFDQFEWQRRRRERHQYRQPGWVGRDRDRLWFRAEGDGEGGRVGDAQAHVLYGRQFSRWWDLVGGIRQDFRPGPAQTWAAIGVQGLAPYWFEVEATAYVGASGVPMPGSRSNTSCC